MTLSELVKNKRAALGLTLDEVSSAAGMSKSHLHGLESGKVPSPSLLLCVRLSVALGINIQLMAACALNEATQEGA